MQQGRVVQQPLRLKERYRRRCRLPVIRMELTLIRRIHPTRRAPERYYSPSRHQPFFQDNFG